MRKWLWLALLSIAASAAIARPWQPTVLAPFSGGSSYSGPIDAIGGSFTQAACYSMRGCSAASAAAGRNAYQLQRESDNATANFAVQANGLVQDPTTFCSGTICHVITWYDQSGNGNHVTQATLAQAPEVTFSCIGSGTSLPCIFFSDFGQNRALATASFATSSAQPVTVSYIAQYATAFSNYQYVMGTTTTGLRSGVGHNAGGGVQITDAESFLTDAVSDDGAFHNVQNVINGASSRLVYDGTAVTGTVTTVNGLTANLQVGQSNGGFGLYGSAAELILFSSSLNSTQTTNLCHNQRVWAATGGSC